MSIKPLFVRADWDEEAHVWVATSDDVPGLATEGDTLEGLVEKLKLLFQNFLMPMGLNKNMKSHSKYSPGDLRLPKERAWMSDYSKELKQHLQKEGCYFERQGKGDHEIWFSPITNIRFVVDNHIKSRHTANAVLKQAGLPKRF